jgi:uncharacterized protein YbaR (Trm112 family)
VAVSPELLEILVCPSCRGPLAVAAGGAGLGCRRCRLCYPVQDDIPVMIPEEATPWAPPPADGGRRP